MRYVVSQRALEAMERECRNHPDTETGGIIVGYRAENLATITHATGPGLNWERSAHHFVKDTDYLQSVLNLLFQYFQVNYLGVWHKHPPAMPYPSSGDVASAMEEVSDRQVGLDELITPICVVRGSKVSIIPFVIKDDAFAQVVWQPTPPARLANASSLDVQWYTRTVGQERLAKELERFREIGVEADVRKGTDGTYRFHVPVGSGSNLVMVCPHEYPVAPPEVAVYDNDSKKYEPVTSHILDIWSIYQYLGDVVEEQRGELAQKSDWKPG